MNPQEEIISDSSVSLGSMFDNFMMNQDGSGETDGILKWLIVSSMIYVLDLEEWLDGSTVSLSIDDDESALLRALERSMLRHISYWMVGFWYVYGTMKVFSNARHLMRIGMLDVHSSLQRVP